VNGNPVDPLTRIVRRSKASALGRDMVETLKAEMSREVHMAMHMHMDMDMDM
jgi:translation elongation factor EF-4